MWLAWDTSLEEEDLNPTFPAPLTLLNSLLLFLFQARGWVKLLFVASTLTLVYVIWGGYGGKEEESISKGRPGEPLRHRLSSKPKTSSPVSLPVLELTQDQHAYFQDNQWPITKDVGCDRWQVLGCLVQPPHFIDEQLEPERGEVTCPGHTAR